MADFETGLSPFSREAGEDLEDKQYYGVKIASDGQAVLVDAITDAFVGILQTETDTIGDAVSIASRGVSFGIAGAAVAAGAALECNASGKFITLTTGVKVGTAMTAASGDGVRFSINLDANGVA